VPLKTLQTMNELIYYESEIEDDNKKLVGKIYFELLLTEAPTQQV
jgi:hypothetical protein